MTDAAPPATVDTLAILGATATGKSQLAIDLAQHLAEHGVTVEIVGGDAMQRYRGMDIGTAKLTIDERAGIPHHQIDVLDPREESTVREYQASARATAEAIRERGHVPMYVGGSGLYLRAALDELEIPPTDATVRSGFEERLAAEGVAALHAELARRDPDAARGIEPHNGRRVVRALEVIELTGRPFSATRPEPIHHRPTLQIGLRVAGGELDARIAARADRMMREGLVDETRRLLAHGMSRTAERATGYPQAAAVVRGELDPEEAIAQIAQATRKLARRQQTWFRPDPRTLWLDASGVDGATLEALWRGGVNHVRAALGA